MKVWTISNEYPPSIYFISCDHSGPLAPPIQYEGSETFSMTILDFPKCDDKE